MLRLIPRKKRRQAATMNVRATDAPLEERRVLSAISATVDMSDHMQSSNASQDEVQLERAYQAAQEARVINGTATSDYAAVGVVNNGCTGTLIAPDVVLTAAHCVEGRNGGYIGDREGTFEVNGQVYKTTKITVHPNYNPNDFGAGFDIAIMKLERAVQGVTPHEINRTTPQTGQMLTLVGFGETGTSTSGSNGDFGNKTVGQTAIDEVTQNHVSWNFDSHNESNTAPGDSGGPAFLNVGGKLVIAGITSGGDGEAGQLGDFSFDTRVDNLASWIDQVAGTSAGDGSNGDTGDNGNDDDGNDDNGGDDTGGDETGGGDTDNGGGATVATVNSTASVAIPTSAATVTSTAQATGLSGNITDINVTLDIKHTWNEDLQVTLISPSGTRVELFDAVGGDSNNFSNTVFDDAAGQSILRADAPFRGTYRPMEDLSAFNGENPNGTWTLEVRDHVDEDGGSVNSFAVKITTDGSGQSDDDNTGDDSDDTGDNTGDDSDGGGDQGSLAQQAIRIDQEYDLTTSGNYFENWGGQNEKWLQSNSGWVFITPNGALYEWTGNGAQGTLIATFSADYHASPELLHEAYENSLTQDNGNDDVETDAAAAVRIDREYGLRTSGNLWENWSGQGEKWMQSDDGWVYITPDGGLYVGRTGELVHQFSSAYHTDPSLLYNAFDNARQQQRDQDDHDNVFARIATGDDGLCSL